MKRQEDKYQIGSGTYPNWLAINTSGPGLTDGSPYLADNINDGWEGVSQAIMHYAFNSGLTQKTNIPAGNIGDPNGFLEAVGQSQILQALQKAHGIGPGNYVPWGIYKSPGAPPAGSGDRVLLLAEQGVLIADYPALDEACWVGPDPANLNTFNAGGYFYRSSDAAGTIPNQAGPYLKLPPQPSPTFLWQYNRTGPGQVTSLPNFDSLNYAIFIPYKTSNGNTWLRGAISANYGSTPKTQVVWTIQGVNFPSVSQQGKTIFFNDEVVNSTTVEATYTFSPNTVTVKHVLTTIDLYITTFDVYTIGFPTWAKQFEYKWGIRY